MKVLALTFAVLFLPAASMADVPTQSQLDAAVKAMKVPSLEKRIKARAAAFRMAAATARMMGFGEDVLTPAKRAHYASLRVGQPSR